jgi:crotonobetainyl-CoA:carnitine CoA-transferase CaiB-like acyl-CoA transferase
VRSQGLVVQVDHPVLGPIDLPGPPLRFDGEEPRAHVAPPMLGQDTRTVLEWLRERET